LDTPDRVGVVVATFRLRKLDVWKMVDIPDLARAHIIPYEPLLGPLHVCKCKRVVKTSRNYGRGVGIHVQSRAYYTLQ
jgi:hypothetical protein